jgi:hypothetical protein
MKPGKIHSAGLWRKTFFLISVLLISVLEYITDIKGGTSD